MFIYLTIERTPMSKVIPVIDANEGRARGSFELDGLGELFIN
jgi:hypothetical protein